MPARSPAPSKFESPSRRAASSDRRSRARGRGSARPLQQHEGVATIVDRLFDVVGPTRAYFGAKDFQRSWSRAASRGDRATSRRLNASRTSGGLALSSRNALLEGDAREDALVLSGASPHLVREPRQEPARRRTARARPDTLRVALEHPGVEVEYAQVRDPGAWAADRRRGSWSAPSALVAAKERDDDEAMESQQRGQVGAVRAHAKVNPALRVLGRRADGYHELETVLVALELADVVTVPRGRGRKAARSVRCARPSSIRSASSDIVDGPDHLAARGAALALEVLGSSAGLEVARRSTSPSRAGLGGEERRRRGNVRSTAPSFDGRAVGVNSMPFTMRCTAARSQRRPRRGCPSSCTARSMYGR